VERFIDDLSTWYVRLSRRRFWKSASDADKRAAQATLYEVLTTLTRLLAPFLPFLSESLYQNLVRSVDPTAPESVHHTTYPEVDTSAIDGDLEQQVEIARRLVGLGRAAREQASIKVRQPLALARVGAPAGAPRLRDELREEIERELNVERLELAGDVGDAVIHAVQAKPALIGPRLGKRVQDVLKALRAGEQTIRDDGSVEVAGEVLTRDEVQISTKAKPGFAAAEADGYTLVLDTRLTPELIQAGLARELVHRIQTMRKDAGFEVEDRIVTHVDGSDDLARVFDRFGEYIKQETLSVALKSNGGGDGYVWSGQLEGQPVTIYVALAGAVSRP
jgi:isoleucyl-tRNA synthetase